MRYRSKTPFIYLALAIGLLASHSARAEDQRVMAGILIAVPLRRCYSALRNNVNTEQRDVTTCQPH